MGKGFILVSHDRDILDACIDHVLVFRKTIEVRAAIFQAGVSGWIILRWRKRKTFERNPKTGGGKKPKSGWIKMRRRK